MTQLTIGVRASPAGTILTLTGDIDLVSSPQLQQAISDVLADGPTNLTIDLEGLRFCDSSGLRALLHGRRDADNRQINYYVTNPHGQVATLFEFTGVLQQLSGPNRPDATAPPDTRRRSGG